MSLTRIFCEYCGKPMMHCLCSKNLSANCTEYIYNGLSMQIESLSTVSVAYDTAYKYASNDSFPFMYTDYKMNNGEDCNE